MKKKIALLAVIIGFSIQSAFAQETFKVMFYNVLNFPFQQTSGIDRTAQLGVILNDYRPDLFMVCELNNSTGANTILNTLQAINTNYTMANFATNSSDDAFGDQNDLQNLIYYDSQKFILENQTEVPTVFRDFNHYRLKLNSVNQDTNPIILHVIVCHLKSSNGSQNQQYRLEMVEDLRDYFDVLIADTTNDFDTNSRVLLGGDLNLYTSSEPAYQELLNNTNNIYFIDPEPITSAQGTAWHNNTNYIKLFSQSTRTQTGMGGATGGFDDRFDFILTSPNLQTDLDLKMVTDSYQVYGNNSNINCYNQNINSSNCSEDSDMNTPDFSSTIRQSLYNFSDHLPVTIELETNATLLSVPEVISINELIKINGTNLVGTTLKLKVNQKLTNKKLNIYNALGQLVNVVFIANNTNIAVDVSSLHSGMYYLTVPSIHVEPLKFIKTH